MVLVSIDTLLFMVLVSILSDPNYPSFNRGFTVPPLYPFNDTSYFPPYTPSLWGTASSLASGVPGDLRVPKLTSVWRGCVLTQV